MKNSTRFHKDRNTGDGYTGVCKKCKHILYGKRYKKRKEFKRIGYMYSNNDILKNKQYIKDRAELFNRHGNGWWWFQGGETRGRHTKSQLSNQRKRFHGEFAKEDK